jgi:hypothetical protein
VKRRSSVFATAQPKCLQTVLASYGFDCPPVSCIVLARPTKSLMLYLQMIGRGLRPAEGKRDCLVLDHSGSVHRFGFAADARAWTLDGLHALVRATRGTRDADEPTPITCPECRAVFSGTRTCPECGHTLRPRGRPVTTLPGELVEIGTRAEDIDRRAFFAELRTIGDERRYKTGWAAVVFRERFGAWPPRDWNDDTKRAPSLATRRWVQSRMIAFAKSRGPRPAA